MSVPVIVRMGSKGKFEKTLKFLESMKTENLVKRLNLNKYGQMGVDALRAATPKRTGKTAESWTYEIFQKGDGLSIRWNNTNINKGVNIAVIIQYGHGTGTGGWVEGVDYINPALKPVFDKIADEMWKEVSNL